MAWRVVGALVVAEMEYILGSSLINDKGKGGRGRVAEGNPLALLSN